MPLSINSGQEAIAQFFYGFILKRAHWYLIITLMKEGVVDSTLVNVFLPLCKLASLSEDASIIFTLPISAALNKLRLFSVGARVGKSKNGYQLMEFEVTHFPLNKKK
jgi:hypothetical protein